LSITDLYEYVNNRRKYDDIRNIMYLKNGNVTLNKFEYLDKNEIPLADRRYSKLYFNKGGEVYIEGSRGCAFCACNICECRDFLGSRNKSFMWRDRPISSIIEEMKILISEGINTVTFADEDFLGDDNYGLKRANEFAIELRKCNLDIKFRINARIKSICNNNDLPEKAQSRKDTFSNLKQVGLSKIFLGFESGSQSQINRYNKGFKLFDFLEAKSILNQLDIDFELGYICLDPLMSFSELKESLLFIKENNCIKSISSIYKELRIQSGNKSYLKKVEKYEKENNMQILGSLDFNEQTYNIITYIDSNITRIRNIMKIYEQETYKLFYLIRILTQYSLDIEDSFITSLIFKTSELIKMNDYNILIDLVKQIEHHNSDKHLFNSLRIHELKRKDIYLNLINQLTNQKNIKYKYLIEIIQSTYSQNSVIPLSSGLLITT